MFIVKIIFVVFLVWVKLVQVYYFYYSFYFEAQYLRHGTFLLEFYNGVSWLKIRLWFWILYQTIFDYFTLDLFFIFKLRSYVPVLLEIRRKQIVCDRLKNLVFKIYFFNVFKWFWIFLNYIYALWILNM